MRLAGLIVVVAVAGMASAAPVPLEEAIADCAAVSGASERLACFDAVAGRLKAAGRQVAAPASTAAAPSPVATPAVSAPAAAPAVAAAPAETPVARFGAEALSRPAAASTEPPAELDEIHAKVVAVQYSPLGRFTISLDNGQIWRQQDGDAKRAQFSSKGGEAVSISRGFLSSYNLVIETRTGLYKVKRVR